MSDMTQSSSSVPNPTTNPTANAPAPVTPVAEKLLQTAPAPAKPAGIVDQLPPFRVLLHNDDHNDMQYVIETLLDLTPLEPTRATRVMFEAHTTGVALVLMTHQERAELYRDQFASKGLKVSIEPGE